MSSSGAGHRFRTSSDTEVLLHGYRAWGTEPARAGSWACSRSPSPTAAATSCSSRATRSARSRCTTWTRPASSPSRRSCARSRRMGVTDGRIDVAALGGYLCLNYVPGDATLLAGVRRLPPASWRLYRPGAVSSGCYWSAHASDETFGNVETAIEGLRERLDRAVRLALVSDVPVGIFLSGGMDSSLVAESAARQGRLTHAYCLDFGEEGFSEWPRAERVARRLGIPLTRVRLRRGRRRRFPPRRRARGRPAGRLIGTASLDDLARGRPRQQGGPGRRRWRRAVRRLPDVPGVAAARPDRERGSRGACVAGWRSRAAAADPRGQGLGELQGDAVRPRAGPADARGALHVERHLAPAPGRPAGPSRGGAPRRAKGRSPLLPIVRVCRPGPACATCSERTSPSTCRTTSSPRSTG